MTQFEIFHIGAGAGNSSEEMNRFLRGHHVIRIDKQFEGGAWHFCVEYTESGPNGNSSSSSGSNGTKKSAIDYREILSPEDIAVYAHIREWRKVEAEKTSVQLFSILTNAQMAEIAQSRPDSKTKLERIAGIGKKRIEAHGEDILKLLSGSHEASRIPVG